MRKIYYTLFALLLFAANTTLAQDIVNIPDAKFKSSLVSNMAINTNGDDEIQVSEAETFNGTITFYHNGIIDASGIEAFINLTKLNLSSNKITQIDLSANTALENIDLSYNMLTSIDVSNNIKLTRLNCNGNQLVRLDVRNGNNHNFTDFSATTNPGLTCISVDNVDYATENWTKIDVQSNFCSDCSATYSFELFITDGTSPLENSILTLNGNQYVANAEGKVFVENIEANVYNYSVKADGYVSSIGRVDVLAKSASVTLVMQAGIDEIVSIPDEKFKLYLLNNPFINVIDDDEIYKCEANAFSSTITIDNSLGVKSIIGIKEFVNLQELIISSYGKVSDVDLSTLAQLRTLKIAYSTTLESYDFSNNPKLSYLSLNLSDEHPSITVLNNPKLKQLSLSNIPDGATFDFSQNALLEELYLYHGLSELDISHNTALKILQISYTDITHIDLSQNTLLEKLSLYENQLTQLDISTCAKLTECAVSKNQLQSVDVSNNPLLTKLLCDNNQLTHLDLRNGNNTILESFSCKENPNLYCVSVDDPSDPKWDTYRSTTDFQFCSDCSSLYTFTLTLLENNTPVSGANIKIRNKEYISDVDGRVVLENIANGDVAYIIQKNGYKSIVESKTVDGENIEATIQMEIGANVVVNIPDSVFKSNLLNDKTLNVIDDSEIFECEANFFKGTLNTGFDVVDLTGIETFINVPIINCREVKATSIDLSQNAALVILRCNSSKLENLDLNHNTQLVELYAQDSPNLSSLDIRNGTNTNISNFNIQNCPNLTCINVDDPSYSHTNWIERGKSIVFSSDCSSSFSAKFTITNNSNPISNATLTINGINYESDDAGEVFVFDLTTDIFNYYIQKDGYISAFAYVSIVDSNIEMNVELLEGNDEIVAIPDTAFKNYLLNNAQINRIPDNEIFVCEASAFTGEISCSGLAIADLTGIEAFKNVSVINCNQNNLTEIDVSQNINLTDLFCSNNVLSELDISNNPKLEILKCYFNTIEILDVSNNPTLEFLHCYNNQLKALNISNGNNEQLGEFNATGNPDLYCVCVDNLEYATTYLWNGIDNQVQFSTDCGIQRTIYFTVSDGVNSIKNATITINEQIRKTNDEGKALYAILEAGNLPYTITYNGYYDLDSSVTVADTDVEVTLVLNKIRNTNATLSTLKMNNVAINNFNKDTLQYGVVLPAGTTKIPSVSATASDQNAVLNITQATALPGTAAVVVTAEDGITTKTYTISFTVATSAKRNKQNSFKLYPNPVSNTLNIEVGNNEKIKSISIISATGRIVSQYNYFANDKRYVLNTNYLKQGLYFVKINCFNKDNITLMKIVKRE